MTDDDIIQVYDGYGNAPAEVPSAIGRVHLEFTDSQIHHGLPSDTQERDTSGAKRITTLRIAALSESQINILLGRIDKETMVISLTDAKFLHTFFQATVKGCMQMGDQHAVTIAYGSYDFTNLNRFPPGHSFI